MMVGLGPGYLAALVWVYLVLRVLYAVVYLRGGAMARGGSLRTLLYALSSMATILLIISVIVRAI